MMKTLCSKSLVRPLVVAAILTLRGAFPSIAAADVIIYPPVIDPIVAASFSADFAALTAHRTVGGIEVNSVVLEDLNGSLGSLDLSELLFGTADALSDPAIVDQGLLTTGIITAAIDPLFFPALMGGKIRLQATFTDTFDALFAIDFLSLTIQTASITMTLFIDSNDGFGVGIPDGGLLPAPLPISIPIGATDTGFDESISSKHINGPEPAAILLWSLGLGVIGFRARRHRRHGRRHLPHS